MKTIQQYLSAMLVLLGVLPVLPATSNAQSTMISASSFDMGFGTSAGSVNVSVTSVVGQGFAGVSRGMNNEIISGLLADTLLRMTVGVKERPELPAACRLDQNYPNPFNPTTKMSFVVGSASGGSLVTLKVYDVLGREVAVLVDEVKHPGRYMVHWNAGNFPSGIYLYRLQTGSFTDTKKMVLMK